MGDVPGMYWFYFWVGVVLCAVVSGYVAGHSVHKRRMKALEILRIYAEKGIEPPASVSRPLLHEMDCDEEEVIKTWEARKPRGDWYAHQGGRYHLGSFAFSLFMAGAAVGVAWWKADTGAGSSWVFYVAVIATAAFTLGGLAHLIAAFIPRRD